MSSDPNSSDYKAPTRGSNLVDSSVAVVAQPSITTNITGSTSMYLGPNVSVINTAAGGLDIGHLQLKTKSILNATGLNIMSIGDSPVCNLSIASSGTVTTATEYSDYSIAYQGEGQYDTTTLYSGADPNFNLSSTQNMLTTQEYVDKQLWQQTKRINTILGTDSEAVNSFNKVLGIVTEMAGYSDTVATLNGIQDSYNTILSDKVEVKTSMTTIVEQSLTTVAVNATVAVWADECQPLPIPKSYTVDSKFGHDGWFFENLNTNEKINWYVPVAAGMKLGNIIQLYLEFYAKSAASQPWVTIYTKPKGDGYDDKRAWYNSKIQYIVPSSVSTDDTHYCHYSNALTLDANGNYVLDVNGNCIGVDQKKIMSIDGGIQEQSCVNAAASILSTTMHPNDEILLIAIHTDSTAAVNTVNCVIKNLSIRQKIGTTQFAFSNAGPASNFMFNTLFKKNTDFTDIYTYDAAGAPVETKVSRHLDLYNAKYGTTA